MNTKALTLLITALLPASAATVAKKPTTVENRMRESTTVFEEIMAADDKGIPTTLLEKAHCIVIVPGVKKGAFIIGAQYGKGFLSCRTGRNSHWSAPGSVRLE